MCDGVLSVDDSDCSLVCCGVLCCVYLILYDILYMFMMRWMTPNTNTNTNTSNCFSGTLVDVPLVIIDLFFLVECFC